jgi:hypothetical protein
VILFVRYILELSSVVLFVADREKMFRSSAIDKSVLDYEKHYFPSKCTEKLPRMTKLEKIWQLPRWLGHLGDF